MKKQTKQSRKTKARKERQAIERKRAQSRMNEWLKTPEGRKAQQLRQAALIGALRNIYLEESGPIRPHIWTRP